MMSTGWTGLSEQWSTLLVVKSLTLLHVSGLTVGLVRTGNWDKDMERVMKKDDGQMMRECVKLGGKRALA